MCDEFSKIKNLRCTFFLFFHADHQGQWLFYPIQVYLVVNWFQKMGRFFIFEKNQKSLKLITLKKKIHFFGRVTSFLGPSRSFSTPNFLSGASRKGFNFMIALDYNLIFEKNQKSLKTFCKNPLLLKIICIFLAT